MNEQDRKEMMGEKNASENEIAHRAFHVEIFF